ncbi:hypothetical protein KIPE111705_16845 [Kibdelosporangium persicum]|uniref:hypothetical protein n=1 Tax=Kibdelosporangium persicum TaxID=2698649 RepID=UPI0028ABEA4C|nr:hypothetical protein [Kibdelosporangium persicum]
MEEDFTRRLFIAMDAKGYGSADHLQQKDIQAALLLAADTAALRSGLDRSTWDKQPGGDGELAALPADMSGIEPKVVDDYPREFAAALSKHNHSLRPAMRLRVRMAIHYGVATPGPNGHVGQGPVVVSRLVDSAPVRAVLAVNDQIDFVVVLSRQVYTDVVLQRHTSLRPEHFRRVAVQNKEFTEEAWVRAPGHEISELSVDESGSAPVTPPASGDHLHASVINKMDYVHAPNSVFGVSNP